MLNMPLALPCNYGTSARFLFCIGPYVLFLIFLMSSVRIRAYISGASIPPMPTPHSLLSSPIPSCSLPSSLLRSRPP